jgi:hypothetical protein
LNQSVILKYKQKQLLNERNLPMVELNEKELCLDIHEKLSWDHSVKYIFDEIKEELSDWYENNLEDIENTGEAFDATSAEMEDCKKFLDDVNGMEKDWPRELKIETLKNIMDHWEQETYRCDCEVSIFDEDIIREGIFQTIEENYGFDGRMGY